MRFRTRIGTLVLAGLLTACGSRASGGFHPSGQAPPNEPSAASSARGVNSTGGTPGAGTTAKTPRSALAAYRYYQQVYERVSETNDTGTLSAVAMEPLLSIITKQVADARAHGVFWRFHNVLNPRIQGGSKDDSTVVIIDCVQTLGSYRFSAKTGKRLAAWQNGSHLYQAIMRYTDGTYKISDATQGRAC